MGSTDRNSPLFRGPYLSAQGYDTHPNLETHYLLISTLLCWREQIPKKEAAGQRFMLLSLFSPFQMQLAVSWNKFPQTNSPPDQLRRTNGELVVKSSGQTTQSFLCQVSVNRGRSHPLLTPHPWLPERYFSGFNHETCFLFSLRSTAQRGMIKSLSKWKIFILCLF